MIILDNSPDLAVDAIDCVHHLFPAVIVRDFLDVMSNLKKEEETPYTEAGRQLFFERTKKKRIHARLDEMYSEKSAREIICCVYVKEPVFPYNR